jgi:MFS family permease
MGRAGASSPVQHQSNGCSYQTVLHDGVVPAEERSAAGGFTGVARTTGAALSPLLVGFMFARTSWLNVPFFLAGALKILYDLLLYKEFVSIPAIEERP